MTIMDVANGASIFASDGAGHRGHGGFFDITGKPDANLALFISAEQNPSPVGSNLVLNLVVTNRGPARATRVVISNALPAGFQNASAVMTQGTWSNAAGALWFYLDNLPSNTAASIVLTTVPSQTGRLY